jgi:hypothetical protein
MKHDLRKLARFAAPTTLLAAGYRGWRVWLGPGLEVHQRSGLTEYGSALGSLNLLLLAALYGRTLLRLTLEREGLRARFPAAGRLFASLERIRDLLSRYHVQTGGAAILSIFTHAWLMTFYRTNLLLYGVLALLLWQGGFGSFLKLRFTPASLKRQVYLAHAQLYTGVAILIFAAFGHLLYADS